MCERNIFLTKTYFSPTQISRSVAGRALGKLVLNLELDMVNRVLKLCLSIQSTTQSGANIYLYKTSIQISYELKTQSCIFSDFVDIFVVVARADNNSVRVKFFAEQCWPADECPAAS